MIVDPMAKQLGKDKSDIFHSVTAKLLFTIKRAKPDYERAVTNRVSKSDEDDWEKLRRVMIFCKDTIDDVWIIGATSLKDLFT